MKPGQDIVERGINDLRSGAETVDSLLVLIGAPRLRRLGFDVPHTVVASPEHRLYQILQETHADAAHSKYNSLIRRLVSFERASECAN